MTEKILVAAPTHECKRYALIPYLRAIGNLKWNNCHFLLVDNSIDEEFSEQIKFLCDYLKKPWSIEHLQNMPQGGEYDEYRIGHSREMIRNFAIEKGFDLWFSLETDVICPPQTIEFLMDFIHEGFDIARHAYPARQDLKSFIDAMGCAIYPVSILKEISWVEENKNYIGGDGAFFQWSLEKGLRICNVFNALSLIHLEG